MIDRRNYRRTSRNLHTSPTTDTIHIHSRDTSVDVPKIPTDGGNRSSRVGTDGNGNRPSTQVWKRLRIAGHGSPLRRRESLSSRRDWRSLRGRRTHCGHRILRDHRIPRRRVFVPTRALRGKPRPEPQLPTSDA